MPALGIVDAVLQQCLADTVGDAAVDLTLDDHRVDDLAEVVDGGPIDDLDHPGIGIDLHLADVATGRKGEILRIVERPLIQAGFHLVEREVVRHHGRGDDFAERLALVGSRYGEVAVLELDIGDRGLEQVGRDLLALFDGFVAGHGNRRPSDRQRARAIGPVSPLDPGRIAMNDIDGVERYAQPVGDDLGERGFVSLAVLMRAGKDGDRAGDGETNLGAFIEPDPRADGAGDVRGRDPAGFDVGGEADAA